MVDNEKQKTDLTQQVGRKNQKRRTCKLFNHPQWSTTKSFQEGALIWPSKQAERIKREEQASYSTIHYGRVRKASKQVHWFDPASRQKESKEKNKQVIQPSTMVDYEKLSSRFTDLSQQAGRKNQSRRLIWPSKQAERIKREEQASYSTIHNGRLRKASKQVHWFDPPIRQKESKKKNKQVIQPSTMVDYEKLPSRCTDLTQQAGRKNQKRRTSKLFNHPQRSTTKSFQAGALIWPKKQAEKIKAKEQASYSTIHNGRLRNASKQLHWFDQASRQKVSKEKNKQVIQPSTTVDYEKLPSRCTDLTRQAGRKNQSRRLFLPSKQAERIKAKEQASYSTIDNGRLRKASKQVHWFDPTSRQKESKEKNKQVIQPSTTVDNEKLPSRFTDLTQQADRKNQSKRTGKLFKHPQWSITKSFQAGVLIWPSKEAERIKAKEQASYSTIHNSRPRKASKQVHWFDPASRQKESKQMTDLTQQAGRKNQRRRTSKLFNHPQWSTTRTFQADALIWPSKQAERIKAEDWFDPASRQKESKEKNKQVIKPVDREKLLSRCTDLTQQAGRKNQSRRLIWPSKQAERIKGEEHASYSTIHNGRQRKASKKVHWFDPASRQKESKEKNKQVIQPYTTVEYEKLPSRYTDLTQQAGRKNQKRRTSKLFNHPQWSTTKSFQAGSLIWPSKQAERIKAEDWFDPASRQKE